MQTTPKTLLLLMGDIVVLYASLAVMLLVRYGSITQAPLFREHIVPFTILFAVWIVVFYIFDLYELQGAKNTLSFYRALVRMLVVAFAIATVFFYLIPFFGITPKTNLFIFLGVFAILFSLWRQFINRTLRSQFRVATVLVGRAERILPLAEKLNHNPQIGYHIVSVFVPTVPPGATSYDFAIKTTQELQQLVPMVRAGRVRILVAEKEAYQSKYIAGGTREILRAAVQVRDLTIFQEEIERKVRLSAIDELWFLQHVATGRRVAYDTFKRLLDVAFGIVLVPIALVLGLFAALAIKMEDGGPVLYTQTRIGENGTPFTMYKFRTMAPDAEKDGARWTAENDPRITKVGALLRKTRLDEFPQLWNILRGDMSFVGPRAERPEFHAKLAKEVPFYDRRHLIRPGLTGWGQLHFTTASASVEDTKEKLAYDFYYLKHRSLIFDIGIILKTANLVIRGMGR